MMSRRVDEDNRDELCLQDLFIAQAVKTPDAIAVIDGETKITYKELDDITDQFAAKLFHEYNVRPDSVVGILMPRCAEYIVAYIAILKAGGAYMPLELVYPKQLLDRAIDQSKTTVVITTSAYGSRVSNHPNFILDDIQSLLKNMDTENNSFISYKQYRQGGERFEPSERPNPDHLAFVVMSSGSTGTPKGICQVHRAAVHSYLDRLNRYPYDNSGEPDRVGAGVFFVWELFRPLCRGHICVVIPDHVIFDPVGVTSFIENYSITRILFTPSLMQLILDSVDAPVVQQKLQTLKYLWFCGEVVTTDLAQKSSKVLPNTELMNLYSISECHDVTIGDLKRDLDPSRKYATCGVLIPGVSLYIVDMEEEAEGQPMKLVPQGETGEVYVGGPVLGRGYLEMPEKTAERFVPNPFDGKSSRLYRTGDLGRLIPSLMSTEDDKQYQLEILGRCDFMVKIRGYSVVLGAIENALAKHDQLCSAVVIAKGDENSKGDKKLIAYVVPKSWENPPSAASVRSFLKDHVPPYAIPSTFCVIDSLPVSATAAGKINRKKLPPVETARRLKAFDTNEDDNMTPSGTSDGKQQRLAPENDTERMVLKVWSGLLDVPAEELSALDSFFEVGGHSLLATKMVHQINEHIGSNVINIMDVIKGPTIRDIAAIIQEKCENKNADATATASEATIDLMAEADALDKSIYPDATRKGNSLSRFHLESTLFTPRVVFLTGATGYLGAHILSELLMDVDPVTVVCLVRASDGATAHDRLRQTLQKFNLLDCVMTSLKQHHRKDSGEDSFDNDLLGSHLIALPGDLSKPLFGMDSIQFKSLALEIDSIIHCGANVNLIQSYEALKEANVLGTQEILRLATTNGFVKTKVKPVHYVSTNGIFPVQLDAYKNTEKKDATGNEKQEVVCDEDWDIKESFIYKNLENGYSMSKWVAERMCSIAEDRGLPVSVLRPGNMAGCTQTGAQNPDDFNTLLIRGMIELGCAPVVDTTYKIDMTPVDFAAKVIVQLAVHSPQDAIGQRMHLQNPQHPVSLTEITEWLRLNGHTLESVTREEWIRRVSSAAEKERQAAQQSSTLMQQVESGWEAFEEYFIASTWLRYGAKNLEKVLKKSNLSCPPVDQALMSKLFPSFP